MAFNGWVDGVCFAKKRKVQAQRAQGMARKLTSRAKASAFREWRETTVEEKRAAMAETHGMTLCRNALARVYRKHKREAWEVWIGTAFPNQHIKSLPDRPDYHDCLRILWSTVYRIPFPIPHTMEYRAGPLSNPGYTRHDQLTLSAFIVPGRVRKTKATTENLKTCLTRKRIAQRWFLRWYWDAFDSDIQVALANILGASENAMDEVGLGGGGGGGASAVKGVRAMKRRDPDPDSFLGSSSCDESDEDEDMMRAGVANAADVMLFGAKKVDHGDKQALEKEAARVLAGQSLHSAKKQNLFDNAVGLGDAAYQGSTDEETSVSSVSSESASPVGAGEFFSPTIGMESDSGVKKTQNLASPTKDKAESETSSESASLNASPRVLGNPGVESYESRIARAVQEQRVAANARRG